MILKYSFISLNSRALSLYHCLGHSANSCDRATAGAASIRDRAFTYNEVVVEMMILAED
jgi:hypothetical protein